MSVNIQYDPVYLIRSYIWALLKANFGYKESDYGGLIPIVPVSESPELEQYNKPYIVYGYTHDGTETEQHYCKRGSMSMAIYSTNFGEIAKILNLLVEVFDQEDDAARTVNEYTSTIDAFKGIRFGTFSIGFLEGPSPEETEGGRESGLINIRYEYFADYGFKIFHTNTNWS